MSLYGAMFSGVSGLNAEAQSLGMISDNISNVNTIGYKTSSAAFSTLVTRQTVNYYAPGGVRSQPVSQVDRQGLLQSSANATDLAVSGKGFFVVAANDAPTANDRRFYTRAGEFATDSTGYLKSPSGYFLQGWRTDATGTPTATDTSTLTSLETIRVSSVSGNATPTSNLELGINLPASAAVGNVQTSYTQVYDSLGVAHTATLTFTKTATNTWRLQVTAAGAGTVDEGAVGAGLGYSVNIVFNGDGTPATFDGAATPPALAIGGWTSGANNSIITVDLGTQNVADGLSQFSSSYNVAFINQNGVQFGSFFGVRVDEDGVVTALYDNGQTLKIYKVPVATFANPNGLEAQNGTVFSESERSGVFVLRAPGANGAGKIVPSSLEASTTDLAAEFTTMIIAQRAYSASAKVITTADEMLDELIRIKR
ncbi:MAG TPA: flagellar hook protein FlgE [Alphaproteobacteria bacterium]